jgi:hypothetical protein
MRPEGAVASRLLSVQVVMKSQRLLGIVLVVVGVVVFVVGMNARSSVADTVSHTFSGSYTRQTAWYLVGGGAAAVFGLLLVLVDGGAKSA